MVFSRVVGGGGGRFLEFESRSWPTSNCSTNQHHLLPPNQPNRTSSYVKLYLLPERSKSGKRKSSVKRAELSPKFDESFTFGPLQLADFGRRTLWLSVWHKDRLGRNEPLGELLIPLAQVRDQLLNSDLCQSTGPLWYELTDRYVSLSLLPAAKGCPR